MTVPSEPAAATARRLMGMQGRDGLWGGFRLRPGESREWVGAVAGFALAEAAGSGLLPPALAAAARHRAERAAAALRACERPDGGWGYNAAVPPDSDSTAAALRLFAALGQDAPSASVGFLMAQGNPVDGWATYGPNRSWDRWSQPCPEVDAAAALALAAAGALNCAALVALWRRLSLMADDHGHWRAYWWPGPGVATLASVQVWDAAGHPDPRPRLPDAATPDLSALDALTLAQARGLVDPAAGARSLAQACRRMTGPGRWPADAVLLAPPRHPASLSGDASPEGRGVLTAAAALRALIALPLECPASLPRPPARAIPQALETLAQALGLSSRTAAQARLAGDALLTPALTAPLPWPNRAVSNLARGWPVEFSATLDPRHRPALRLAADAGDPRLLPGARARAARVSLIRAARVLSLDPAPLIRGLAPLLACARHADPGERFLIWGGFDLTDDPDGAILKAYGNLALAGADRDARLALAARVIVAAGGIDVLPDLMRLDRALQAGHPQQMGLALAAPGLAGIKVYWELPGHDPLATRRLAAAVGLDPQDGFTPEIPGIASRAAARRGLSGLAIRIDPARGVVPELTLATQAERGIAWHPAHEAAAIRHWARGLGLSPDAALNLMAVLRSSGAAPRSLHTLTLGPGGRLRAAVYCHADGWLATRLARPAAPPPAPDPIAFPAHSPAPAPLAGGLS